ncbi:hypothetical protein [Dapis sp. BLCC M229]|uniref:hypothetical protein n=1 Tax=Dapis sp. BLCC M229 TaxID=3400188 RepID=UPI003CEB72D2
MTTTELEQKFISDIAGELFEKENGQETDNEVLFRLRFSRDNYELPNQTINQLMIDKSRLITDIQRRIRKCMKDLKEKYSQEILADIGEENCQRLTDSEPGQKEIWKIAYKWLWNDKFLRWVETNFWSCLEKRAKNNLDWINLQDDTEMAMVERLNIPKVKAKKTLKVSVEKPYWVLIDLPEYEGYFLLLNQGVVSRCIVCPSWAFALDYQLEKIRLLPQKESLAYEEECRFTFNEIGKEKFVAIALEKPLNLAWLKPNEEEVAPDLTPERMQELWQELEKQNNWRVYSQQVEVVG